MKIGSKLMVSFSLILALTLVVGTLGWYQLTSVNQSYERMLGDRVQKILWVKDLKYLAADQTKYVRGYLITGDTAQMEAYSQDRVVFAETWEKLHNMLESEQGIALSNQLRDQEEQYATVVNEITGYKKAGNDAMYIKLVAEKCVPMATAIAKTAQELEDYQQMLLHETQLETNAVVSGVKQALLFTVLLAIVLGALLAFFITRSISRPVIAVSEAAGRIADGDLTGADLTLHRSDEIGEMAEAFNRMKNQLASLLAAIHRNAQEVTSSSRELSTGSEQSAAGAGAIAEAIQAISESASEQVARIKHNQAAMQESVESLQRIAQSASITAESSADAMSRAEEGGRELERTVIQIDQVRQTLEQQQQLINRLGEQSRKIDEITVFIKELASQTHLLSLNASIEAARAGEHGRGFAVVAGEVKKLAELSGDASGRIAAEIEQMVRGIREAMTETARGAAEMKEGAERIGVTGAAFAAVREAVATVAEQTQEVSAATEEITAMTEQILSAEQGLVQLSGAISDESQSVAAVCEEQLASSEEMSASAETLSDMASHLMREVSRFRFAETASADAGSRAGQSPGAASAQAQGAQAQPGVAVQPRSETGAA